jgi:hypothetical protein
MALIADQLANIAQRVRQCNKVTLVRAYARAARQFCSETRWYRVNLSGTLAAGTRTYSLGSDPDLEIITAQSVSVTNGTRVIGLRAMAPSAINPNIPQGQPIRFAYLPEGSIAYDPVPDQAYPTLIELAAQVRDEATDVPNELLVKWRQAFEAGALEFLLSMTGQPWADPQAAALERAKFRSFINNAKADVQRGFQVGAVRALPRRFVTR